MTKYRFFDPNEPIFEIRHGVRLEKAFLIYADGRIEGFGEFEPQVIINRIPDAIMRAFKSRDD